MYIRTIKTKGAMNFRKKQKDTWEVFKEENGK